MCELLSNPRVIRKILPSFLIFISLHVVSHSEAYYENNFFKQNNRSDSTQKQVSSLIYTFTYMQQRHMIIQFFLFLFTFDHFHLMLKRKI